MKALKAGAGRVNDGITILHDFMYTLRIQGNISNKLVDLYSMNVFFKDLG